MGVLIRNEEVVGGLDAAVASKIGTATLTTSASDLSGAINEHETDITGINNSITTINNTLSQLPTRYPNITPIQGSSSVTLQCGYGVGKLMGLTCEINVVSANQNSWVNIGNIAVKPRNTVKIAALRTGNGTHCGMVEIQDTGLVRLYTTQALSNNSITFTVSYEAKDLN